MAEALILQRRLFEAQNPDGGWGYQTDGCFVEPSWTEPTALALLALAAQRASGAALSAGFNWLLRNQRADGGWPPQPAVTQSTWVTSLAALALAGHDPARATQRRAIAWLLIQILPGDLSFSRFLSRVLGVPPDPRPTGGSPWFPGTAAWVGPTAMSILALSYYAAMHQDAQLTRQVSRAQEFILSRRCRDGGWNHGGSKYRSDNANSYPEMTGMALLALRGADPTKLLFPLERAAEFVRSPTSIEALSWLQLGLLAHGRDTRAVQTDLPCRTVRDISLRLLALTGNSNANRLFVA